MHAMDIQDMYALHGHHGQDKKHIMEKAASSCHGHRRHHGHNATEARLPSPAALPPAAPVCSGIAAEVAHALPGPR